MFMVVLFHQLDKVVKPEDLLIYSTRRVGEIKEAVAS